MSLFTKDYNIMCTFSIQKRISLLIYNSHKKIRQSIRLNDYI